MKALIVMPLAHRHGGAENILWTFLRGVDRSRVDPVLVFFDDGPFRREVEQIGIPTHVLRPSDVPRPRIARFTPRLAGVVRSERPDLVFSWLVEAQTFAAIASLLARTGARVAWWQANIPKADFVERLCAALPTEAVFAYSNATAAIQRSIWPHRRTIVVHPGIDAPEQADSAALEELRRHYVLPADKPIVGIVGRLQAWKGQHHLIAAVAELRDRGHDVHGLIVGGNAYDFDPDYEPRLRALVRERALEDAITFTGQVENGSLHMQLMDVVVNASAAEPFGIVLLEAMALERPVVAVDAAGPSEIIESGTSGVLVARDDPVLFADAIEPLVSDPAARARLAAGGLRRFQERFTSERMVRELTEALERIAFRS